MKNSARKMQSTTPYNGDARLVLADGRVFHGRSFGARTTSIGEVVFNTSLTGYQEILTDPSYAGQFVCLTTPEIGNVGTNPDDEESRGHGCLGLLVRTVSPVVSNHRSTESLPAYLARRGIPGIAEFDTRALTRHLRDRGAMMAALCCDGSKTVDELWALATGAKPMDGCDLASTVTTAKTYEWDQGSWGESSLPEPDVCVVVYDYGVKLSILRRLRDAGARVVVVPAATPVAEVLAHRPDGVLLSNGPGDPAAVEIAVTRIRELLADAPILPVFVICLGHQLLSLALGGQTYKLKFGHHGGNHPVRDEATGAVAITAQNHGFAVELDSLGDGAALSHLNLFDRTVAGLRLRDRPVSSVQYHPEDAPGPHDSRGLLQGFVTQLRSRVTRAAAS